MTSDREVTIYITATFYVDDDDFENTHHNDEYEMVENFKREARSCMNGMSGAGLIVVDGEQS
jgi:hypothetical protein